MRSNKCTYWKLRNFEYKFIMFIGIKKIVTINDVKILHKPESIEYSGVHDLIRNLIPIIALHIRVTRYATLKKIESSIFISFR